MKEELFVKKHYPNAFIRINSDTTNNIVSSRGVIEKIIGIGQTSLQAWISAKGNILQDIQTHIYNFNTAYPVGSIIFWRAIVADDTTIQNVVVRKRAICRNGIPMCKFVDKGAYCSIEQKHLVDIIPLSEEAQIEFILKGIKNSFFTNCSETDIKNTKRLYELIVENDNDFGKGLGKFICTFPEGIKALKAVIQANENQ